MPPRKSSSRSDGSRPNASRSSRNPVKFIPNLTQINEAAAELPDPDLWPEPTYLSPIEVDGKQRQIAFNLKSIKRGKEQAPRWIYEGKVLIRKRDV